MSLINYEDVVDIVFDNYNEDLEDILDLLSALPKTDIVRCKDCKFGVYEKGRGIYHTRCEILEFLFQDDDYCSYGERREEQWQED